MLVASTAEILEKNFEDKIGLVRGEYEKRLRHLGDAIRETCRNVISDDVLAEMKTDPTSSAFIPAHLHEMIEMQFTNEREAYIHGLVAKVSSLELDASKRVQMHEDLQKRLAHAQDEALAGKNAERVVHELRTSLSNLEGQCAALTQENKVALEEALRSNEELTQQNGALNHQVDDLRNRLNLSAQECDILTTENQSRAREIEMLERTNADASRGLDVLHDAEERERKATEALRLELNSTTRQKDMLSREVQELSARFKYARDELERTKASIEAKEFDEGSNRKRMAHLMQQVEAMLAQEASESNATVTVLHQKMKQLKHRYAMDMQREKRISASLQDELTAVKAAREDNMRELRLLTDDCSRLRDGLKSEQEKNGALALKAQASEDAEVYAKNQLAEALTRTQQAELRAEEVTRTRAEQIRIAEERARLDMERRMGHERAELESRASAYRLKFQSELGDLSSQLRHSFSFGDTMKSPHPSAHNHHGHHHSGHHHHHHGHHHSGHHHHHHGHHHAPHDDDEKAHMKAQLREAAGHIERLKSMVIEMRAASAAKATVGLGHAEQEKYEAEIKKLQGLLTDARADAIHANSGTDKVALLEKELAEVREQAAQDHALDASIIDDMKSKFDKLMHMHNNSDDGSKREEKLKEALAEKDETIHDLQEQLANSRTAEEAEQHAGMLAEYRRQIATYSERLEDEMARRQELQRELQEEKVAHRSTQEQMNAALLEMQRRAEQAEFAFSQLKMGVDADGSER